MNGGDERAGGGDGARQHSRRGASGKVRRWFGVGIGPALLVGAVLLLGVVFPGHHPAHPRVASLSVARPRPQTPFEASFSRAQQWYLRAEIVSKQQLEAWEEWDGAALRGSAPETLHRSLMARARETVLAEAAAREAAGRARTSDEMYRAARLLAHIERDLGHHEAELAQAKKLVALRPHHPEARLLLERALDERAGPYE